MHHDSGKIVFFSIKIISYYKTIYKNQIFQKTVCEIFKAAGILVTKGGRNMKMKGWAITLGVGAAAGAVAVMMLPKQSAARRLVNKAACVVEDTACTVGEKLSSKMDM